MTIPEEKLREILALADKATPGKWVKRHLDGSGSFPGFFTLIAESRECVVDTATLDDAEHIAACSPDTVKAIVQELLAARAEEKRLLKLLGAPFCKKHDFQHCYDCELTEDEKREIEKL